MLRRILFLTAYALLPLLPATVLFFNNPEKYTTPYSASSMLLGVIAYSWLTLEFVLSARPKFVERYFGMDRLYRSHGYLAVVSLIFVTLHRTILEGVMGETTTAKLGTAAWITFSSVVVVTLLFMINSRIKLRTVKYQHLKAFHNLSVIGLALMLIHVLTTYSAETITAVKVIYVTYFAGATLFYLYHRIAKPLMLKRNLYKVIGVQRDADTMWTVKLSPLKGENLPFKPGQFGYLTIYGETISREAHPFSFSSSPDDDTGLAFTIKELGDYTSGIGDIHPGYTATIDGPYGRFSYLNYPDEEITVLIAGGVGITPALSMLRYMRHRDKEHRALLLWGANNRDELICYDELREMVKEMHSFSLIPVILRDDSWDGEKGFIDKPLLQRVMSDYRLNAAPAGYYVCGPPGMMASVQKNLSALGVHNGRIHSENFSF